jgi:glycerol uptake operon antiterminator
MFKNQRVIPAISTHQALKKFIKSNHEFGIVMNFQLAQLKDIVDVMKKANKKVLIHLELMKGIANDEYGAIYLIQELRVDGIITTKPKVIECCKKRGVIGILRFFLKDTLSLNQSIDLVQKVQPDLLEVLPAIPKSLELLKGRIGSPIMLGGLIQSKAQVIECIESGALAVTTSHEPLWI